MKGKFCESLIIIKHQEPSQDSIPPCLYLEFLIYLTMVSEEMAFPYGTSVKVLLRSNLRNLFKTPKIQHLKLHLSNMSLPGLWEDMEVPDKPGDGVI